MSNYEKASYGPGEIAALPPTIGLTSRAPTIGSQDYGRPIPMAYNLGTVPAGESRWALPLGIGLIIGGTIALLRMR